MTDYGLSANIYYKPADYCQKSGGILSHMETSPLIMVLHGGLGVCPKHESVFRKARKTNSNCQWLPVTLQYIQFHKHKQSKER